MNRLFRTITSTRPENGDAERSPQGTPESLIPYTKVMIRDLKAHLTRPDGKKRPVVVGIEARVQDNAKWKEDSPDDVFNFDAIISAIPVIAESGHICLAETLAEYIADFCLHDRRVKQVTVRVDMSDSLGLAGSLGIEVFRSR